MPFTSGHAKIFTLNHGKEVIGDLIEFPDGAVALRWRGDNPVSEFHHNIESVKTTHVDVQVVRV